MSPDPIEILVQNLSRLPGVGEKTALRLTLHLLKQQKHQIIDLAQSLINVANNVVECIRCCNLTAMAPLCVICNKTGRDETVLCVVSSIQDLMAIEKSSIFMGNYHVLHGVLQPINGIGPNELRIKQLLERCQSKIIKEVVLATPSSIEGEATAIYLKEILSDEPLKISRIASGVPVGGDLQYADRLSLAKSLLNRHFM
jgi:recombination protein RecR